MPMAGLQRGRAHHPAQRRHQCHRTILVDTSHPLGADLRRGAVSISVAGLGHDFGVCAVGRRTDGGPHRRLDDRGRLGLVPALARNAQAEAAPAGGDPMTTAAGPANAERPADTQRDRAPLGIAYMLGATVMFAVASALSKWLVAIYPFGEVLVVRTSISLIAILAFVLPSTGLAVFHTRRLGAHVTRSIGQSAAQT